MSVTPLERAILALDRADREQVRAVLHGLHLLAAPKVAEVFKEAFELVDVVDARERYVGRYVDREVWAAHPDIP